MFRALFARVLLTALSASLAVPAWAQEAACPDGEPCDEALRLGAWGLIAIGLLFLTLWFRPKPRPSENEAGQVGLPGMGFLQVLIRRETTGWRRWQWPVMGIFFIGLGLAFLWGGR